VRGARERGIGEDADALGLVTREGGKRGREKMKQRIGEKRAISRCWRGKCEGESQKNIRGTGKRKTSLQKRKKQKEKDYGEKTGGDKGSSARSSITFSFPEDEPLPKGAGSATKSKRLKS